MDRDYREAAGFKNEKYSRPEAYLDLICLANWEDKTWCGITIKKGSFITSKQALADRWKWTRQSVLRLLKWLKSRTLIDSQTVRVAGGECTLITISDYDKNQRITSFSDIGALQPPNSTRTLNGPEPYPTKEEEIIIRNNISNKKEITKRKQCASVPSLIEDPNLNSWLEYRKQISKPLKPKSIEALIGKFREDPVGMKAQVDNSIANGYQGLFPPKTNNGYKPHTAASTVEHNLEYLRRTQNEPVDLERLFNVFSDCEEEPGINPRIGGGLVPSTRKLIG